MKKYKTPEVVRIAMKLRRDAIKEAGGAAYLALLEKERARRALFRQRHPDKVKADRCKRERSRVRPLKSELVRRARRRARKGGMDATIRLVDIIWPTHCPVLGIELDYKRHGRISNNPANPTLDRWDNSKGYVSGNVFVISWRANTLKNNAAWQELEAVMRYARDGLSALPTRTENT